jgi:hypothetical protein
VLGEVFARKIKHEDSTWALPKDQKNDVFNTIMAEVASCKAGNNIDETYEL